MKALLLIAEAVQADGRQVTSAMVDGARAEGATVVEIHDTVLIAAAFCMFNQYVDGLGTLAPDDPQRYVAAARLKGASSATRGVTCVDVVLAG
jgi:hypothetical protein